MLLSTIRFLSMHKIKISISILSAMLISLVIFKNHQPLLLRFLLVFLVWIPVVALVYPAINSLIELHHRMIRKNIYFQNPTSICSRPFAILKRRKLPHLFQSVLWWSNLKGIRFAPAPCKATNTTTTTDTKLPQKPLWI